MSDAPKRPRRAAGPPPNAARLREAALAHLARFAATEVGLRRVLERRISRWARAAEAEGQSREAIAASAAALNGEIASIAKSLVAAGAVNDAAFAESRARRLARSGHSRRAMPRTSPPKGSRTRPPPLPCRKVKRLSYWPHWPFVVAVGLAPLRARRPMRQRG
jgi:regulatory protein